MLILAQHTKTLRQTGNALFIFEETQEPLRLDFKILRVGDYSRMQILRFGFAFIHTRQIRVSIFRRVWDTAA